MRIFFTLLTSFIVLLLSSCKSFNSSDTPPKNPTMKIGIMLPMSGERSYSGQQTIDGIFLAHDLINRRGPVRGKMIKLVIIDNKSSIKGSRMAMRRLTEKENVSLVIAACNTANALAIKPIAQMSETPVLLTISTGNIATERNPYMFRCCFNDSFQGKAMASFAYKNKMYNSIGILFDLNDKVTYRRDLARAFAAEFKKLSGKNVEEVGYHSEAGSLIYPLKKFRGINTAAIFAPSDVYDARTILKEARKNGLYRTFLGSDGWDRPELFENCGSRPKPCYVTSMFSIDSELPGVKEFVRSIKARTGSAPTTDTAQAYDALNIVAEAIRLSRTKDIRSGLYQIKNYSGVTGKISIDATGNSEKTIFIKEIVKDADGKFSFRLVKTVSPK